MSFYPRHPRGWRHIESFIDLTGFFVSIHATLAGGDGYKMHRQLPHLRFYPRHPRGWRPLLRCLRLKRPVFLSTPPSRVATWVSIDECERELCFYPRHPRGWRPRSFSLRCTPSEVSIHATLAGGDVLRAAGANAGRRFYPRHPRGWRPALRACPGASPRVSIHATLAGGDRAAGV